MRFSPRRPNPDARPRRRAKDRSRAARIEQAMDARRRQLELGGYGLTRIQ